MIRIDSHACTPVAWFNGGGLTRELARGPGTSAQAAFGWRLSLADIERDGRFSSMAGCERIFALVEGAIALELPQGRMALDARSDPLQFAGEAAPMAELSGDSICRALNLMAARDRWTGQMRRVRLADGQPLACDRANSSVRPGSVRAESAADARDADPQPVHGCFVCRGRLMVQGSQVEAGEYLQFDPADAMPTAIGTVSLLQFQIHPIPFRSAGPPPAAAPSAA